MVGDRGLPTLYPRTSELYSSKYFIPPLPNDYLIRPRLVVQMNDALMKRFILVKAPAGFGKTSIVIEWLTQLDERYQKAWFSLESKDNDLGRFIVSLMGAVSELIPVEANSVIESLDVRSDYQPILIEELLPPVCRALMTCQRPTVLVLDDYQFIVNESIHRCISFLLDNLPQNVTLLITSRCQPEFPMAKLRVKRQLFELNENALRLNREEIASFVQAAGVAHAAHVVKTESHLRLPSLELSSEELDGLEKRTEGWVTGVLLICENLQKNNLPSLRCINMAGSDGFVAEYIVEEVLNNQPQELQRLLADIAPFESFNAEFCDFIRGRCDSDLLIRQMQKQSLFLVPLDSNGHWYRLHHLFLDVLQNRYLDNKSLDNKALYNKNLGNYKIMYRKASQWFFNAGDLTTAVEFALRADDIKEAGKIVVDLSEQLLIDRDITKLLSWKSELPEAVILGSPRLIIIYSWALALGCLLDAAEELLQQIKFFGDSDKNYNKDNLKDNHKNSDLDDELIGRIYGLQAYIAAERGDAELAIDLAQRAYLRLPEFCLASRLMCMSTLAFGYLALGETAFAFEQFNNAVTVANYSADSSLRCFALIDLAKGQLSHEKLSAAELCLAELEQLIQSSGDGIAHATPYVTSNVVPYAAPYVVQGQTKILRGTLALMKNERLSATDQLQQGIKIASQCRDINVLYAYSKLVDLHVWSGQLEDALGCIQEAERLMHIWDIPQSYFLARLTNHKCQIWLEQGHCVLAATWLTKLDLFLQNQELQNMSRQNSVLQSRKGSPFDMDVDIGVRVNLTIAQLNITTQQFSAAIVVLDQILSRTLKTGAVGAQVQACLAKGIALYACQKRHEAFFSLREAFHLAKSHQLFLGFFLLHKPLQEVLNGMQRNKDYHSLYEDISAIFNVQNTPSVDANEQALDNVLSSREMKVIALIAQGLSNQAIAERLFISLHTVKSHARKINVKLAVNSRTQAIVRAQSLGLLG